MQAFLKKHYEKILLASLLTVFICLLVFQLILWQQGDQIQVMSLKGFKQPPPNYVAVKFEAEDSPYNQLARLASYPYWEKSISRDGSRNFSDLFVPYALAICPYCNRVIPSNAFPAVNTLERGICPYPDCRKTLRAPLRTILAENIDSDNDLIPDKEEVALGLNPKDPTDAFVDNDDDGFNNYEEYVAKTKINDSKSHPPYYEKIRVSSIVRARLPFMLKNVFFTDKKDKKGATIQIEIKIRRPSGEGTKNELLRVGDPFLTLVGRFQILDIIPEFTTNATGLEVNSSKIIVQRDDTKEKLTVEIGKPVDEPREKITLISEGNKQELELFVGSEFTVGTLRTNVDKYKVVSCDQAARTVVLLYDQDGKEHTVGPKTIMQSKLDAVKRPPRPPQTPRDENRR